MMTHHLNHLRKWNWIIECTQSLIRLINCAIIRAGVFYRKRFSQKVSLVFLQFEIGLSKRRECFRKKIPDDWIKLYHLEIVCHNDCELYHNDWKMYYTNGDIRSQWLDYIFRVRIRLLIGSCRPSSGGISREFWWFDSVMMNNFRHGVLNSVTRFLRKKY